VPRVKVVHLFHALGCVLGTAFSLKSIVKAVGGARYGAIGKVSIGKSSGLTTRDIFKLLEQEIKKAGGQSEWARQHQVSRTHLNKALRGRKTFGPTILKALKIKSIYVQDESGA
jgi:hypothetical protein